LLNSSIKEAIEPSAILVGRTDGILREIGRPLVEAGFQVTAFAPAGDPVWNLKGIQDVIEIPDIGVKEQIAFIFENQKIFRLTGWFFWSSNEMADAILSTKISDEEKSRLLNGVLLTEAKIIGSRVNQVNLFNKSSLPSPRSRAIYSAAELQSSKLSAPMLVKADKGGGGEGIFEYVSGRNNRELSSMEFPVVLQEKVIGKTFHVEVFFASGKLIYWAYSEEVDKGEGYGYCPTREYSLPQDREFLDSITKLGEYLKLSGPVGTAFVRETSTGLCKLIEFDLNCGLWHHSFSFFRFPLVQAWRKALSGEVVQHLDLAPNISNRIKLYDQQEILGRALLKRKWSLWFIAFFGMRTRKWGTPMPSQFSRRIAIRQLMTKAIRKASIVVIRYKSTLPFES